MSAALYNIKKQCILSCVILSYGCVDLPKRENVTAIYNAPQIKVDDNTNRFEYMYTLEKAIALSETATRLPLDTSNPKTLFPADNGGVCWVNAHCLRLWSLRPTDVQHLEKQVNHYMDSLEDGVAAIWSYAVLMEKGHVMPNRADPIMDALFIEKRRDHDDALVGVALDAIAEIITDKSKYIDVVTAMAVNRESEGVDAAAYVLSTMGHKSLSKYPVVMRAIRDSVHKGDAGHASVLLGVLSVWGYVMEEDAQILDKMIRDSSDEMLRANAMEVLVSGCSPLSVAIIREGEINPKLRDMAIYGKKLIYSYGVDMYPPHSYHLYHRTKILRAYDKEKWSVPLFTPWNMNDMRELETEMNKQQQTDQKPKESKNVLEK